MGPLDFEGQTHQVYSPHTQFEPRRLNCRNPSPSTIRPWGASANHFLYAYTARPASRASFFPILLFARYLPESTGTTCFLSNPTEARTSCCHRTRRRSRKCKTSSACTCMHSKEPQYRVWMRCCKFSSRPHRALPAHSAGFSPKADP